MNAESSQDTEQSFLSHLIELRQRLIRALLAVVVVMIALAPWTKEIYDVLAQPLLAALPQGSRMIATGIVTPFLVPLKLTLMVAFVLALPYVIYQGWAFVAPGLYKHEKRLVLPIVVSSFLMFLLGVAFCYFVVFRLLFPVILGFAPQSITLAPDIEAYFGFALTLFLAFGLTFETPVVLVVITRLGMVSVAQLRSARPYFIVGAFIVAAIVTPPDVYSQFMLALPLCVLYELGIVLAAMFSKISRGQGGE
ncbi:MAG TPA: twin-arginine translocase subunit TatC [Burkholderiaceae bacterium]|nr:twin-arginine translocase subunit TatC [Burkholderiaceae bacterium]